MSLLIPNGIPLDNNGQVGWAWYLVAENIVEVNPTHDIKQHGMLDECWCNPKVENLKVNITCNDGFTRGAKMFVHNSAYEAKYGGLYGEGNKR